jgi:hypothetical protein
MLSIAALTPAQVVLCAVEECDVVPIELAGCVAEHGDEAQRPDLQPRMHVRMHFYMHAQSLSHNIYLSNLYYSLL